MHAIHHLVSEKNISFICCLAGGQLNLCIVAKQRNALHSSIQIRSHSHTVRCMYFIVFVSQCPIRLYIWNLVLKTTNIHAYRIHTHDHRKVRRQQKICRLLFLVLRVNRKNFAFNPYSIHTRYLTKSYRSCVLHKSVIGKKTVCTRR